MLQAIKFDSENGTLEVLDQLQLPHKMNYIKIARVEQGWNAINKMQVSGYFVYLLVREKCEMFLR